MFDLKPLLLMCRAHYHAAVWHSKDRTVKFVYLYSRMTSRLRWILHVNTRVQWWRRAHTTHPGVFMTVTDSPPTSVWAYDKHVRVIFFFIILIWIYCVLHFLRPVNLSLNSYSVKNKLLLFPLTLRISVLKRDNRSCCFDVDGWSTRKCGIDARENQRFYLKGINRSWSITNLYVWIIFKSVILFFQPQMLFSPVTVERAGFVFHK